MHSNYLIFSACYLPHLGGVEIFTENLAHELCAEGNKVYIVTNKLPGLSDLSVDEYGVTVIRVPCISFLGGRFCLNSFIKSHSLLKEKLGSTEIDGVLINTRFYFLSIFGLIYSKSRGIKPVVLDHGSAYLSFGSPILNLAAKAYEHFITFIGKGFSPDYYGISEKSCEWLRNFSIEAKGIISNSIDATAFSSSSSGRSFREEFQLKSNCLLVAVAGRLIPEKGIAQIIEASSNEELIDRDVVFIIAGDGPMKAEVEKACSSNFIYVGRLNRNDMAALFLDSDLLCLPSRSEGFCTTLLEASACGCPSLTTDVGVASELILNDSYGSIMESGDAAEIVERLKYLDSNRKLLKTQSNNIWERAVGDFSFSKTAQQAENAMNANR